MRDVRSFMSGELLARRYLTVAKDCDARAALEHDRATRERAESDALKARRSAACVRIEGYLPEGPDGERLIATLDYWLSQHADGAALDALLALLDPRND